MPLLRKLCPYPGVFILCLYSLGLNAQILCCDQLVSKKSSALKSRFALSEKKQVVMQKLFAHAKTAESGAEKRKSSEGVNEVHLKGLGLGLR